jgi:isopenicillin N synthase-like dioxygenase
MASAANIPLIDISATGEEAQLKVAKELADAAVEHGFVYIRNTGGDIPADAVDRAFNLVGFRLDTGLYQCTLTNEIRRARGYLTPLWKRR